MCWRYYQQYYYNTTQFWQHVEASSSFVSSFDSIIFGKPLSDSNGAVLLKSYATVNIWLGICVFAGSVPMLMMGNWLMFFNFKYWQIGLHRCVRKKFSKPFVPRFPRPNALTFSLEWTCGSVYTSPTPWMSQTSNFFLLASYVKCPNAWGVFLSYSDTQPTLLLYFLYDPSIYSSTWHTGLPSRCFKWSTYASRKVTFLGGS